MLERSGVAPARRARAAQGAAGQRAGLGAARELRGRRVEDAPRARAGGDRPAAAPRAHGRPGRKAMLTGFSVDPQRVLDATRAVRMRMRPDSVLHLRSPAGSDLTVKLDPRPAGRSAWASSAPAGGRTCRAESSSRAPPTSAGSSSPTPAWAGPSAPPRGDHRAHAREVRDQGRRVQGRAVRRPGARHGPRVGAAGRAQQRPRRAWPSSAPTSASATRPARPSAIRTCRACTWASAPRSPAATGATWDSPTQMLCTATGSDVDLDGTPLLRSGRYLVL